MDGIILWLLGVPLIVIVILYPDQRALASQLKIEMRENLRRICGTMPVRITAWSLPMPMVALAC
jgi:hypothetical protein